MKEEAKESGSGKQKVNSADSEDVLANLDPLRVG